MGRHINTDNLPPDVQSFTFPGGEPHVILDDPASWAGSVIIDARVRTWNDWGKLLFLIGAIVEAHGKHEGEVTLYTATGVEWGTTIEPNTIDIFLPYFPGARMDRVEDANMPLSVDIYADQLASMLVDVAYDVHVLDIHSELAQSIIELHLPNTSFYTSDTFDSIVFADRFYDVVIAPDKGAIHRAADFIRSVLPTPNAEEAELWVAEKQRDFDTGHITGYALDVPQDEWEVPRSILVVDDICDGGATFNILAEQFPDCWAVDLCVTHGIFSKGVDNISPKYDRIYTTDSLWHNWSNPRIVRIPVPVFDLKEST